MTGSSGSITKTVVPRMWALCVALIYPDKRAMLPPVHLCSLFLSCSFRCHLPVHTKADYLGLREGIETILQINSEILAIYIHNTVAS